MKEIHIYTDGAAKGNPGKGGYGVLMVLQGTDYKKEYFDGYRLTTNNRMELLAVIIALQQIKDFSCKILIFSDSKYVVDAINKNWIFAWRKKAYKDVKNPDLWKKLIELLTKFKSIEFNWVKGHNGNIFNERVDFLAVKGSELIDLKVDSFYENNKN